MKTIVKISILIFVVVMSGSCLRKDLPNLPLYVGNSITNFYVEFRFEDTTTLYNGQPVVAYQKLVVSQSIDTTAHTITASINVPAVNGKFTAAQRAKVSLNALWPYFDISTAATIKAVGSTPAAGDVTDCGKPLTYQVTSASGKSQTWTVTVTALNK